VREARSSSEVERSDPSDDTRPVLVLVPDQGPAVPDTSSLSVSTSLI
jgi:hypothetical protein